MPAVWFMAGMTPHGLFHPMANSSIFHGKRLQWLSRTVSPWNTAPFDHQSRNSLLGEWVFSAESPPACRRHISPPDLNQSQPPWDFSRAAGYAAFDLQLAEARQKLLADPNEPRILASFGEWYAFRDAPEWAIELLERARNGGVPVSSLTLARCYWQMNDFDSARREFDRALELQKAPRSYLQLCLSAVMKPVQGYSIDKDDVVFMFEPAAYGTKMATDAEVLVAGDFNHWLDNDKGTITNDYPQWVMQRMDEDHYVLRKKIADFRQQPLWQFRFVVNKSQWPEVPDDARNSVGQDGFLNLALTIPPLTTKTSPSQN